MRDIEVVAQQLANEVRIGILGIEQLNAVCEAASLGPQFGQLRFSMLKLLARIRPCADAGRPNECQGGKGYYADCRRDLPHPPPPRTGLRNNAAPAANKALVALRCIMAKNVTIAHGLQENHTKALESSGFRQFCRQSAIKCGERDEKSQNASPMET